MFHFKHLHSNFKLNGKGYSKVELLTYAQTLSTGKTYEKGIGSFLIDWLSTSQTVQVTTSGSTGKPKNISLKKEQMIHSAMATGRYFNLQTMNTTLLCLSADFIAGKMMLVRAMVLGLHLDFIDPSISSISKIDKKYDFSAMVPLQVEASLDKLHYLQKLIVGGAPISIGLRTKLQNAKTEVFETYGMTETCTHVAVKRLNNSAFKALPNVTFSIDERNCLCIDAPKIVDETIVTNDVVKLENSTGFAWLGRYDNVINSGGIKLHPEQLEAKLSTFMKPNFFVAGMPDDALGTKLILLVESTKKAPELLEEIIASGLFTKYELPKNINFLPEFVRTKNGKIQREETLKILQE